MTKKHFDALAAALRDVRPEVSLLNYHALPRVDQWRADCEAAADFCARFNPKFNRGRFLEACGVTDRA